MTAAVTAHDDAQLSACTFESFSVEDGSGNSLWPPPSAAPALSISNPQNYTPVLNLSWTPGASVAPITGYNILRGTSSGSETSYQTVSGSTTSYSDTGVNFGATYYYVMRAVSGTAVSPNSNEVFAMPTPVPPRTQKLGSRHMCGCSTASLPGPASLAAIAAALLLLAAARRP